MQTQMTNTFKFSFVSTEWKDPVYIWLNPLLKFSTISIQGNCSSVINDSICTLQCSASCGGGEQYRQVQCVDDAMEHPAEGCDPDGKPLTIRRCSKNLCPQAQHSRETGHLHNFIERYKMYNTFVKVMSENLISFRHKGLSEWKNLTWI